MSRLTRDGTAEPVSRDQILRHEQRGQGNIHFSCSVDHVQDWQPYPVDPYSFRENSEHTYRPSEHPPVMGGKVSKRLGGIKGCKYKTFAICRYFQHAHFIPIVGVGKRGEY